MIAERIISNIAEGVMVTCPSEWAISALQSGGYWQWLGFPKDYMHVQIERMLKRGVSYRAAENYAVAMTYGGASRSRAIEIIAERDVAHVGTMLDIVDVSEIPTSRKHREAWRRSSNGGPIYIDDYLATKIDEQRMWAEYLKDSRGHA